MQWLFALETDNDPIPTCRLMNIFRRKGLKIVTLALAAQAAGYSLMALVETRETEVEHLFNFLRRTEGVRHVTYYRHEPSSDCSLVFIDADPNTSSVARILEKFPECRLIFANQGQWLLEVPMESRSRNFVPDLLGAKFLPFARVKTTRRVPSPEMVGAMLER